MNIDRRLRIDFTWVLAGNVIYSACQWIIVVVLAKLGSPEQVGEYALGVAVSVPILLFANLQLRSLLASDVEDRFPFSHYFTFRLLSLAAALMVVAGAAALTTRDRHQAGVIILVGSIQALELVSETYYGFMQRQSRMDRVARSLIFRAPLSLAAMGIVMYFTRSIVWALVALALGRFVVLIAWDWTFALSKGESSVRVRSALQGTPALLRIALPLGVISMLGAINANIPRYFVQGSAGTAELGMYSAVASLLSAGTLVVSAYGQSVFLPVARACATLNRSAFRKFAALTTVLGATLGVIAVLISLFFGQTILTHLFRPEYGKHADVLVRLMIGGTMAFVASGLGFVMTAARSLRPQVPLLLVTGLVTAAACAILIPGKGLPGNGLVGAADAVIVGSLTQLIGTGVILLAIDRRLRNTSGLSYATPGKASEMVEMEAIL